MDGKIVSLVVGAVLLAGCAGSPHKASYMVELGDVDRPVDTERNLGELSVFTAPDNSLPLSCEDDLIEVHFTPNWTGMQFEIENKTDQPIRVNWDDAVFVTPLNDCQRVLPSGYQYSERNAPKLPETIVPHCMLKRSVIPTVQVDWEISKYGGHWLEYPILPQYSDGDYSEFEEWVASFEGVTYSLMLPLEVEDQVYHYVFHFFIKESKAEKGRPSGIGGGEVGGQQKRKQEEPLMPTNNQIAVGVWGVLMSRT